VNLVPGFVVLLQALSPTMTTPTFESLVTVVTGWVFSGRGTVTRSILSAGDLATKHFSSYHCLFSAARWSLDALGLAVFALLEPWLGEVVMLGVDDTLTPKRGHKIFGVGMHHDPLRSTRSRPVTSWGLSWVSLGVILRLPFRPDHNCYLPLLFRLYQNKTAAAKSRRTYRSRPELAVELLRLLCNHQKNRRFHVVADSAYGAPERAVQPAGELRPHEPASCHGPTLRPATRSGKRPQGPAADAGCSPSVPCGDARKPLPSRHTRHLRQVSKGTGR
jgi:hypothetical protein